MSTQDIQNDCQQRKPARLVSPFSAALLYLWALLTLSSLNVAPLFDYDEAANAQAAVGLRDGKWLLPTMNGRQFYEKPALLFYFMNVSFALFGRNAFAARLTSALFTLATALYLSFVGRRIDQPRAGMTAALIYLSMLMPALLAHAAIFDATLNFWIAVSILSFSLWQHTGLPRHAVLSMFAAGAAVSVKGPVGAVIPFLVMLIDRLSGKDSARPLSVFPWSGGIAAFFAGALPWYILVSVVFGFGFLKEFILVENLHRFLHPMEGHGGGVYYYLLILIPSALPWTAWLPWWLQQTVLRWKENETLDRISRLCAVWTLAVLVLFSISQTKLPHYISSIYPAVALGIGAQFARSRPGKSWSRAAVLILMSLGIPVALALLSLPALYPRLAGMVSHPRAVAVLTQDIRPGFGMPAAGAVVLLSLFLVFLLTARDHSRKTLTPFIVFGLILQSSLVWSTGPWAGRLLQGQLLDIAASIRTFPATETVYSLVNCPSVSFYSGRSYIETSPAELQRLPSASAPYLLIAHAGSLPDLSYLPLTIVMREKDFVLLRYARAGSGAPPTPRKGF